VASIAVSDTGAYRKNHPPFSSKWKIYDGDFVIKKLILKVKICL
jgi:hypothetical protein